MRKTILLLSTLGVGAGFLYALKNNRGRQGSKTPETVGHNGEDQVESESGNGSSSISLDSENGSSGETHGRGASMARIENDVPTTSSDEVEPEIDDRGTDQFEASQILKNIRDSAFDSSDEKLALALGRPTEEIEEWTSGVGTIDGDVVMKARALAIQRGLEVE